MLALDGLKARRGDGEDQFVLNMDAFRLSRGEAVAITGPSGSGKSTFLEIAGLITEPAATSSFTLTTSAGTYDLKKHWDRGETDKLAAIRAREMGFVLQTGGLLPFLTVEENAYLSQRLVNGRHDAAAVGEMLDVLGIAKLRSRRPSELSIGERQRSAIARAVAHKPEILFADEPTASLDPKSAENAMQLLIKLVNEFGMMAIIVTHDWGLAERFGLREFRAASQSSDGGRTYTFEEYDYGDH